MSTAGEKLKGKVEQAIGTAKEKIGAMNNDPDMELDGADQRDDGAAREAVGTAGQQLKGAAEKLGGKLKNAAGALSGDTGTQVSGKMDELKGNLRQKLNQH
jgi:uncharacterized protein YjbJ (UPF0337 family)